MPASEPDHAADGHPIVKRGLFAAAFALLAISTAHADSVWTDSSGKVSLRLPDNWVVVDPSESAVRYQGDILTTRPADPEILAQCNVGITSRPLPSNPSREALNEATQHFPTPPAPAGGTIDSLTVTHLGDVSVLDMVNSTERLRTISRRFFLRAPNELRLYTVGCSAWRADDAAMAAIHSVADSLQVTEGQATP